MHPRTFPHRSTNDSRPQQGLPGRETSRDEHRGEAVMNARDGYPLRRDDAEHRRLAAQAAFWAADAAALFDAAGLAPGDRVADLGCGTAHVPLDLLRRVGATGRVFALDNDARLLGAMDADRPLQLEPVLADAFATPWPDGMLDAVHARFLAAPCGRVDALVAEMLRVVRPGGLLMLQEPVADSWRIPGAAWSRLRALIRAGFAERGGDFDVGRTLRTRLARTLVDVRERRVVHRLPAGHPYAALPLAFCDALESTWRRADLAGDDELRSLRSQVEQALRRPGAGATTFTLVQVWGRKPAPAPRVAAASRRRS